MIHLSMKGDFDMQCKKCGAALEEGSAFCPACGKKAKKRGRRPIFPIRWLMQGLSLVLFLALMAGLLATVLLADVRILTSSGGIETILTHLVTPENTQQSPSTTPPMGAAGVMLYNMYEFDGYVVDDDGNIIAPDGTVLGNINDPDSIQLPDGVELPDDLQIPSQALTSPNALAEYVHELAQQILGGDVPVTVDQVLAFIVESNIMEFVAEKASTLVEDVLAGTPAEETAPIITADELVQLVEDNETLLEKHFNVELTEDIKQDMALQIHESFDDAALNQTLRDSVDQTLAQPVPGMNSLTISDLLAKLRVFTQTKFIIAAAAVCVALMALLMLLNYYDLPRGLRWSASACTSVGSLLAAPLLVLQVSPVLLKNLLPETAEALALVGGAARVISPLHYGLLAFGIVLLVVSVVWRALAKHN